MHALRSRLHLRALLHTANAIFRYYFSFAGGRILIGVIAVGSGLFRALGGTTSVNFAWLNSVDYGVLQLIFGIAVLATVHKRLTLIGRISAIALACTYSLLISDILAYPASSLLDTLQSVLRGLFFGEPFPFSVVSFWGALCYVAYLIIIEAGAHDEC